MGKLFIKLQTLLPQHRLSRLTAWFAECRWPLVKNPLIFLFVQIFRVDLSEARLQRCRDFQHFNDFFTRELLPDRRPLAGDSQILVSPADGTISQLGRLDQESLVQAKGMHYTLSDLLGGDDQDVRLFRDGSFMTVYLSPKDYHRVHMPLAGKLLRTVYLPGQLYSVNRVTTRQLPNLFTRNERMVCLFDTAAGPMAVIMVGAMIVAGIQTVWSGKPRPEGLEAQRRNYNRLTSQVRLDRGAEMGRFLLGSTVILLFGPRVAKLEKTLQPDQPIRLGQAIGRIPDSGRGPAIRSQQADESYSRKT